MDNQKLKECLLKGDQETLVHEVADEYVNSISDELEAQQSEMVSKEMLVQREKQQMEDTLNSPEYDEQLAQAFVILGENFGDFVSDEDKVSIKQVVDAVGSNKMMAKCEDPDYDLLGELEEKELWQFFGLEVENLDALNRLTAKYLENMEGDKAYSLYCLLTLLDATQPHFWHGMGLAQVLRDKVQESIPLYETAYSLNEKDVGPLLSIIYAYTALDQTNLAEDVLKKAIDVAEQHPQEDPTYAKELKNLAESIKSVSSTRE